MRRIPFRPFICLAIILVLAACRQEPVPPAEPTSTLTAAEAATAVAGTVESITASMRGEETTRVAPPDAVLAPQPESGQTGEGAGVIYSLPFEARPDGFSFRNYGSGFPEGDFTLADLRKLFGDGVCSRIEADGDRCIPTAEALQWIADRNADMSYGHCIGFTVTSFRFAEGDLQVNQFSASSSEPYDIEQQTTIMRTIAANGSLYWVQSVWSSEVGGTPREVLDALIALGEPVDLSIFLPGLTGGHSLLAYGVEEVAPQQYRIHVYDNNFPGEDAFVEVDYAANTWRYGQGAVNPDETAITYQGDATTNTLRFIPLSAYESVACPFCPPEVEQVDEETGITLLSFIGQGDVLVKTALGNIGVVAGEIINDLPGARILFQRGQLAAKDAPDIVLPGGLDYTVEFNNMQRVSGMSSESSVVVDKLTPVADQSTLDVAFSNRSVAFQAGGEQAPVLKTTVRQEEATYSVALLGVAFADGQSVSMSAAKSDGKLAIQSNAADVSDGTLLVARLTSESEAIFATTTLNVDAESAVGLDLSGWDGEGSLDIYTDEDGDGNFDDQPAALANEPLSSVIQNGNQGIASEVIGNVSPFLGEDGMDSVLTTLAEQGLSGKEIGDILRPLGLDNAHLINLLLTYDLPVPELAELIFALHLDPEPTDALILGLELTAADETELRESLDNLALYQQIIDEWEFRNSDDLSELAAVLSDHDLTATQLIDLFPRMGLTSAEIELVLGNMTLSESDLEQIVTELDLSMDAIHAVTPVATSTRRVTPTATGTSTATATPTTTATPTAITTPPTATTTADQTVAATASPTPTAGALPLPTQTALAYPYPGALPQPTRTPSPYPYPGPALTPTPTFTSRALCDGDDLRIIAKEPGWLDTTVEIRVGEIVVDEGQTGPDGEAYEVTFSGPSTWEGLSLVSTVPPLEVPLGTFTCPNEDQQ